MFNPLHAFEVLGQGRGAAQLMRGVQGFQAAPNVTSAWQTASGLVGVVGVNRVVGALVRIGVKLATKARGADEDTAGAMVSEMQAEAPHRTGLLQRSITFEIDEEGFAVVHVEALNQQGRDYARFVEFGTAQTAAQPFFMDVAERALEQHGSTLDEAIGQAAQGEGMT